jgi:tetratricopeptide (TPR) repeat protein
MTTRTTSLIRTAAPCFAASLLALVLSGCASQGQYTRDGKSMAQARLDALKSQTEHEMAVEALLSGDRDKANRHCEKAITLNPKSPSHLTLRGRIMLEQGDLQKAAQALDLAESYAPDSVDVHYYQGLLAERVQRKDEALTRYVRAAELDQTDPQYPIAASEMMIDLGRLDEAEQYLLSKHEVFSHTPGIVQSLGHIALMKNDLATAERRFTDARTLNPDEPTILEDLARAQYMNGNYADAQNTLAKLTRQQGMTQRRDLLHMRARCLMELGRNIEARDVLVALTKTDEGETDAEAWISLGQVAYQLRDGTKLRQAFTRIIAIAPQRPEGYILKGLHQRRSGDDAGAEQSFKKALGFEQSSQNYTLLGLAQLRQGKAAEAQKSFQAAAAADPSDTLAGQLAASREMAERMAQNVD